MNDFFDVPSNNKSNLIGTFVGVTTGIVKENWDSKFPGMVKVEVMLGETGKTQTKWIRVLSPYAGKNYGYYALPEVGDEVLVSFNMGNTNRPYVLGSLWNNKNKIPEGTANEKNTIKKLVTKGGHEIIFDEEDKKEKIEITTPKKLKISLEDEKEVINIQDKSGNNILTINSKNGEITLKAKSKISFDAGGKAKITLDGKGNSVEIKAGNININAQQQLKLKGQKLAEEGNMVEIKGTGSVKVNSSAMLELKGSIAKIN